MQAVSIYIIEVKGQLEEKTINAASPIQLVVEKISVAGTKFTVRTDQSGLVGLIRFLHRQGFIILSLNREINDELPKEKEITYGS